ncbi:uncharacterized protein LOC110717214 [Chenopodium quinoa]|uniref:uncharacterized protein LOC110717214 n=1 Tax=Chenopodium quinoa TaxID=63459 RepID=UPI000B7812AC|nr:uncharacterized protein LOC110717214 [Chenopodium quinoa]
MEKIKIPSCKYDGKGDPKRYVAAFESHMLLYTDTDVVWCKVFPITLTGAASDWFSNLEPGQVDYFKTLVEMFTGQYISNSARQRSSGELMAVGQKKDESLRDFIRRFNNEANTIPKLQQEIVMMAFMSGLSDCDFKKYMAWKTFSNLGPAFNKAHEYIKSEELLKANNRVAPAELSRWPIDNAMHEMSRPAEQNQQRADRLAKGLGRYNNYTLLNTLMATIYSVNQQREYWAKLVLGTLLDVEDQREGERIQ